MPNLSEISQWEAGIYKIEEDDVVQGGDDGISNRAAIQLANRTLFLKEQQTAHQEAADPHTQYLRDDQKATQAQAIAGLDNESWMTALRVAQAINALATTIANASETVAGKVELATPAETITGLDTTRATHAAGVKAAIDAAVAALLDSTPATLDTLNELAAALGDDANFATSMATALAGKLSIADFNASISGKPYVAALLNFDGSIAGSITPRLSYNIASVLRNGAGNYTATFSSEIPANYVMLTSFGGDTAAAYFTINTAIEAPATTHCTFRAGSHNGAGVDAVRCNLVIFGIAP